MNSYRWIGLSEDENAVNLHRFAGVTSSDLLDIAELSEPEKGSLKVCAAIDVETSGLDFRSEEIIEVGLRLYYFESSCGKIRAYGESYSALQEIDRPLNPEIVRLTGIMDEDLKGQAIDWEQVDSLLSQADIVVAHNANFDRPFVEKYSEVAKRAPWGCSLDQVDWSSWGFPVRKLEVLSLYHGFFIRAHRALADVEALMHLLQFLCPDNESNTYFNCLLVAARKPLIRVVAANSPFESKDLLKHRGYYWEPKAKYWHRKIFKEDWQVELEWLEAEVYSGEFRGYTRDIKLNENFRALN